MAGTDDPAPMVAAARREGGGRTNGRSGTREAGTETAFPATWFRGCAEWSNRRSPPHAARDAVPERERLVRMAVRALRTSKGTMANVQLLPQGDSTGAGASSCSRPARSPARPMAPCWRAMATRSCCARRSARKSAKPGQDFFPLTVNYQEKAFAAGKIPGGFFKREGRPSEKETLVSRLIDRPIRPLFPEGFRNEVQVVATVLSHDLENDPDIVAMIGCSAALTLSGIPFFGPVAAARVGYDRRPVRAQPDRGADGEVEARPRGRRHRRGRADGGERGAGADRGGDARRRDVRPPAASSR